MTAFGLKHKRCLTELDKRLIKMRKEQDKATAVSGAAAAKKILPVDSGNTE